MNERNELVRLIRENRKPWATNSEHQEMEDAQASAILEAGYRKPRIITTKQEVEALPDESVIRDGAGDVAEKRGEVWCSYETAPMTNRQLAKYMPIEVLWEPTP